MLSEAVCRLVAAVIGRCREAKLTAGLLCSSFKGQTAVLMGWARFRARDELGTEQ